MATYYFNAAVNGTWATAGNWWQEIGCTTPAGAAPTAPNTAYIVSGTIDEIPVGETCDTNAGTITTNNGTVTTNDGTITTNSATGVVTTNNLTVTTNDGTVTTNSAFGTIGTNNEMVTLNEGTVTENYDTVLKNVGIITVAADSGTVYQYTGGDIGGSGGTVYLSDTGATITIGTCIVSINPNGFSNPTVANVKEGQTYKYDSVTVIGTLRSGGGINGSGILGTI